MIKPEVGPPSTSMTHVRSAQDLHVTDINTDSLLNWVKTRMTELTHTFNSSRYSCKHCLPASLPANPPLGFCAASAGASVISREPSGRGSLARLHMRRLPMARSLALAMLSMQTFFLCALPFDSTASFPWSKTG